MTIPIRRITYRDMAVEQTRDNETDVMTVLGDPASQGHLRGLLHLRGAHLLSPDMLEAERLADHPRAAQIDVYIQARFSNGSHLMSLRDALLAWSRTDGSPYDAVARVLVSTSPTWAPDDAHPSGGALDAEWRDSVYLLDYARQVLRDDNQPYALAVYTVWTRDTEDRQAWMDLASIANYRPAGQDSGRCSFRVETTDAPALEVALDADADVIRYEVAKDA